MKYEKALQKLIDLYLVGQDLEKDGDTYILWVKLPEPMPLMFPVDYKWPEEMEDLVDMLKPHIGKISTQCVSRLHKYYKTKNDPKMYDDELFQRIKRKIYNRLKELIAFYS